MVFMLENSCSTLARTIHHCLFFNYKVSPPCRQRVVTAWGSMRCVVLLPSLSLRTDMYFFRHYCPNNNLFEL